MEMVRHGEHCPSANTVQKHLDAFWVETRRKLEVRLSMPGFPDGLKQSFEGFAEKLWEECSMASEAGLTERRGQLEAEFVSLKQQAEIGVSAAEARLDERDAECRALRGEISGLRDTMGRMTAESAALQQRLDASNEKIDELSAKLNDAGNEIVRQRQEFELRAESFSAEKDRLKEEAQRVSSLLSSADEKIMQFKLTVQREVDRGEAFRKEAEQLRNEVEMSVRRVASEKKLLREENDALKGELSSTVSNSESLAKQVELLLLQIAGKDRDISELHRRRALDGEPRAHIVLMGDGSARLAFPEELPETYAGASSIALYMERGGD